MAMAPRPGSTRTEDTYTIPDVCGSKARFTVTRYERVPIEWLIEELLREDTDGSNH